MAKEVHVRLQPGYGGKRFLDARLSEKGRGDIYRADSAQVQLVPGVTAEEPQDPL